MVPGLDGTKLIELLEEELMGLEWEVHPDDVATQADDEYLEDGARRIKVWGMAQLPRTIYILEVEQLRKEIAGKTVSLDIELTLTVSATSQLAAKGRGENVRTAYENLMKGLADHLYDLQRGQRALEMLGLLKDAHNTEHSLYSGWDGST